MFYAPNIPYAIYLAIKAKNPVFFTAANPAIKSSGNGTESKYEVLQLIPEKFRPKSVLVPPYSNFNNVIHQLNEKEITYPLIAKPDIGFRGLLVTKIYSADKLKQYLKKYPINIILQEFLDYENECGVFYHRNPNSKKGWISSLTLKRFLTVTGDGKSTLNQLINKNTRAKLHINFLTEIHQEKLNKVPNKNELIKLSVVGNHSKGTQFINGNHLISKKLEQTFDELSTSIQGWYYGRVDIKYNTFNELESGSCFKILEINGILAEPTHIYDSENYTYFQALKAIRHHWKSLFKIATANHQKHNVSYKSSRVFIKEMVNLNNYTKKIKRLKSKK